MGDYLPAPEVPALPPGWDGFHPLVVHFPVALLAIAPLFLLLASITGYRSMMFSASVLLTLGVAGAYAATFTGEEAYAVVEPSATTYEVDPDDKYFEVMEEHQGKSHKARNIFAFIAAAYAVAVAAAYAKPSTTRFVPRTIVGVAFLAASIYANLLLAEAAHLGGELVHNYGINATLQEGPPPDYAASSDGDASDGDNQSEAGDADDADSVDAGGNADNSGDAGPAPPAGSD